MQPRLTCVTLGISDLARSLEFYRDKLGWPTQSKVEDGVLFFQMNGLILSFFPREELAKDANVDPRGAGFYAFTLAHNVNSAAEVDQVMADAERAGATIRKPAQKTFWGGYSGYFSDPDGFLWEVAHNPFWKMDEKGGVSLT
ncbi:VOC family protein [Candidatus Peregrinibacteria bacterium]|nr:VOC family protein [Candidatus Peregrinibacteria bacterium]